MRKLKQEQFHAREYGRIIAGRRKNKRGILERQSDRFRNRNAVQIDKFDLFSLLFEKIGQLFASLFCMSVDRSAGNKDAILFGRIRAPFIIEVKIAAQIVRKDRSVKRTDRFNIQSGQFLQRILYLHTIFAYDICIIPACLAHPVIVVIDRTEFSERVGREQELFFRNIRHHDFRPVDHRSHEELQCIFADRQRLRFLDYDLAFCKTVDIKEIRQHIECVHRGNQFQIRVHGAQFLDIGRMIRFHMRNHKVICRSAIQCFLQIFEPFLCLAHIDRVHDHRFLIQDHIGIV